MAVDRGKPGSYNFFFKPIACGEKVVGTTKGAPAAVIESTYGDALAVEMEAFEFLSAIERRDAPALLIQGICDMLDDKEATEDLHWPSRTRQTWYFG